MEKTKKNKSSQLKKIGAMPVLEDASMKLIESRQSLEVGSSQYVSESKRTKNDEMP
jgi:hypothetical protein